MSEEKEFDELAWVISSKGDGTPPSEKEVALAVSQMGKAGVERAWISFRHPSRYVGRLAEKSEDSWRLSEWTDAPRTPQAVIIARKGSAEADALELLKWGGESGARQMALLSFTPSGKIFSQDIEKTSEAEAAGRIAELSMTEEPANDEFDERWSGQDLALLEKCEKIIGDSSSTVRAAKRIAEKIFSMHPGKILPTTLMDDMQKKPEWLVLPEDFREGWRESIERGAMRLDLWSICIMRMGESGIQKMENEESALKEAHVLRQSIAEKGAVPKKRREL